MFTLVDCNNFWSPSGGGVRRYHLEKMEYFKSRSDVKYVFIMHDSQTYTEQIGENAFIEHLKVPKVMGNWEYRYLVRSAPLAPVLTKHNPDVIEVGSPYFMPRIVQSIVRNNKLKSKVFGFWHADFPITYVKRFLQGFPLDLESRGEQVAWSYARKYYNNMTGIVASSQIIIDRMRDNGLNNIHFVPLGVNEQLFHPNKLNQDLRNRLQAGNPDRLVMFFPHRFCQEKGLRVLLEAYEIILKRLDVEPCLVLAGMGPDLDLVKKAAERFEHVHYKGFINGKDEMAAYYASADLGFALSAWETFGLSLVESLSAGLPLIAAGDGAAREHIERSQAGYVLKDINPENLSENIVAFVNLPDESKSSLKSLARAYAEKLSWQNCFDKQLDIYQQA